MDKGSSSGYTIMEPKNQQLIRQCLDNIGNDINKLSRIFYQKLFLLDPDLQQVFPGGSVILNRKFANMMSTLKNIWEIEKMTPSIVRLGERHLRRYGAQIEYFDTAREALLLALSEYLGERFNPPLQTAWHQVFDQVAALMNQAMAEVDRRKEPRARASHDYHDPDLLADIGGSAVVQRVHERFYRVIFEHPWLGYFFRGKHEDVLATKQTQFMVAAFGGENHYQGDTPAFVHMHMFITDKMADVRQALLRQAILDEGLSAEIAQRWLRVDDAFRDAIVKTSVDQCVVRCRGQMPIVAPDP